MNNRNKSIGGGTVLALCLFFCMSQLAAAQASEKPKMATATPAGIAAPRRGLRPRPRSRPASAP
jgi:hypothetical protein